MQKVKPMFLFQAGYRILEKEGKEEKSTTLSKTTNYKQAVKKVMEPVILSIESALKIPLWDSIS